MNKTDVAFSEFTSDEEEMANDKLRDVNFICSLCATYCKCKVIENCVGNGESYLNGGRQPQEMFIVVAWSIVCSTWR